MGTVFFVFVFTVMIFNKNMIHDTLCTMMMKMKRSAELFYQGWPTVRVSHGDRSVALRTLAAARPRGNWAQSLARPHPVPPAEPLAADAASRKSSRAAAACLIRRMHSSSTSTRSRLSGSSPAFAAAARQRVPRLGGVNRSRAGSTTMRPGGPVQENIRATGRQTTNGAPNLLKTTRAMRQTQSC